MVAYVPELNEQDPKKVILSLQQVAAGRSNATGTVTLTINVASTVVTPARAGTIAAASVTPSGLTLPASQPILTPLTAAAAAELASGNMYVSAVAKDTFTITHTNSATAGRTFAYAILG
jgi:hypothetical protein